MLVLHSSQLFSSRTQAKEGVYVYTSAVATLQVPAGHGSPWQVIEAEPWVTFASNS